MRNTGHGGAAASSFLAMCAPELDQKLSWHEDRQKFRLPEYRDRQKVGAMGVGEAGVGQRDVSAGCTGQSAGGTQDAVWPLLGMSGFSAHTLSSACRMSHIEGFAQNFLSANKY